MGLVSTEVDSNVSNSSDIDQEENKVSTVWRKLLTLLEKQGAEVSRMGGAYVLEMYKESQFIMAALADEIFLHMEWDDKNTWHGNLLETRLFGSHAAGEIFFEKLDRLLQNRDPIYTDLGKVFFIALALGFQGKYRGVSETDWLDFYRRELFRFIYQKEPDIFTESSPFFVQAYTHNMEESVGLKLPNPRKWVFILGILAIGLVLVSHGIWLDLINDLEQLLHEILEDERYA